MNKDLDDRLIPNGEYRDAQNISVGKSEEDDIGSLEPILGNAIDGTQSIRNSSVATVNTIIAIGSTTVTLSANPGPGYGANVGMALVAGGITYGYIKSRNALVLTLVQALTVAIPASTVLTFTIPNLKVIGYFSDEGGSRIITFLTDYNDTASASSPVYAPSEGVGSNHFIRIGDRTIVSGNFLNFSQNAFITGVSLIENLLFWTDNRNQPRKINLELADNSYYDSENTISVAKYNPYDPIQLVKKTTSTGATSTNNIITLAAENTAIKLGMDLISTNAGSPVISPTQYLYVEAIAATAPFTVTLNANPTVDIVVGDELVFIDSTMTGEDISPFFNGVAMPGTSNWPGDPDYLQDRFVRFSYRFQFDDGEYSTMAPFTQITYIPKQKGYFLGSGGATATPKDEDDAYRSTVVEFMENGVQNIDLIIPLPDTGSAIASKNKYKISNIDILYKESDALAVKVVDTILASSLSGNDSTTYTYEYQSRKPYKVLPEAQTTRVYDTVPVRAFSQETAGNRIIYGNFQDKHTSPEALNYNVAVGDKALTSEITNWVEYPNSTLKQNRNYQVGFVLADKWGRQSTVVLSTVDEGLTDGIFFGGSTIYVPYNASTSDVRNWFGDALKVLVNAGVGTETKKFSSGIPGLYATPTNSSGYNSFSAGTPPLIVSDTSYSFTLGATFQAIPVVGSYLRGQYIDFVEVTNVTNDGAVPPRYTITTTGRVNESYLQTKLVDPDRKFAYTLNNPLGWYSYKVVVRQQEQDYYNVYLPGILNDYPTQKANPDIPFPLGEANKTANIVLINDNINKIPRDLNEVGPEQKQFRSSVQLFGRVENNSAVTNRQYYPGIKTDTAVNIATSADSNMEYAQLSSTTTIGNPPGGQDNLYQIDTKPLIARLSTANAIGSLSNVMRPYLAIYETEPQESLLDIFWETTQTGLIADLNSAVAVDFSGPVDFEAIVWDGKEDDNTGVPLTNLFYPINSSSAPLPATTAIMTVSSSSFDGQSTDNRTADFTLVQITAAGADQYKYRIDSATLFDFDKESSVTDVFTFSIILTSTATPALFPPTTITKTYALENITPCFWDGSACYAGTALPDVNASVDDTTNIITRNAVNGSFANNTTDLFYSLDTATVSAGFFTITATGSSGGQIDKLSNTPIGTYDLTVTVKDAYSGTLGNFGGGSITKSMTQKIIVGPTPLNTEAKSGPLLGCVTKGVFNTGGFTNGQSMPNVNGTDAFSAFYIVATDYVGVPSFVIPQGAGTTTFTPTATDTSIGSKYYHRLGTGAVTQGTLVLSLNMSQTFTNQGSGLSLVGSVSGFTTWRIYRRANASSAWALVTDINNETTADPGVITSTAVSTFDAGTPFTGYAQTVYAFNQTGEYLITATSNTGQAAVQADAPISWVDSNDLYFSTCVVENGADKTDGGSPRTYKYNLTNSTNGYTCVTPSFSTGFAQTPYANYVTEFYTTTALNVVKIPATPFFYGFVTDSLTSEPFSTLKYSAKFNATTGVKISSGLTSFTTPQNPCSGDRFALGCAGSSISCAHITISGSNNTY